MLPGAAGVPGLWVLAGAGGAAASGGLPGWVLDGMPWVLHSVLAGALLVCMSKLWLITSDAAAWRSPA